MRISELSRRSGVSVATIKYYIREGLLPSGRPTAATQAEYGEQHLRRVRLVRALISVRGLSVHTTRAVLGTLSRELPETHRVLGLATGAIRLAEETVHGSHQQAEVDTLIHEMGWHIHQDAPARTTLTDILTTLHGLGVPLNRQTLFSYARLAEETAMVDLEQLEGVEDPLELAERTILLTTLLEPALLALRRLAQEHQSTGRHSR